MSGGKKRHEEDDEIIFLETESRDAVAKALAEAERAIEAVEERHRQKLDETSPPSRPGPDAGHRPAARVAGGGDLGCPRARAPWPGRSRGDEGARDPR